MTTAVRVLRHAIALGFVAGLALGLPAAAQNGPPRLNFNSGAPIEILADSLEVQDSSSSAVFVGNVKVTQDRMILRADRLEVIYAGGSVADAAGGGPSGIKRITAKGNVFVTSGEDSAQGDAAVYDPAKGTVTMTGKVLLTRGENVLRGSELVVNLNTGRSVMTGGGSDADGRVKGLIVPEKKTGQ